MRRSLRLALFLSSAGAGILAGTPARSTVHIVTQSSLTFNPPSVNVVEGDTVKWVWTSLSHTVTNGTGSLDPAAGTLFDAPLNSTNTTFQYQFTTAGSYPYFCRPHEGFDMKGTVVVDLATAIRPRAAASAVLHENVPNPFGARTEIAFELSRSSRVILRVYDVRGARVATLLDAVRSGGAHSVPWDGRDDGGRLLPNGVYLCRLEAGGVSVTRKLVLIQ